MERSRYREAIKKSSDMDLGDVERTISKNGDYSMSKVARQTIKNKLPLEAQTWKSMWDKVQDSTGITNPHIFVQKFQHRFVPFILPSFGLPC
jgi:hypothetical protein